jgi:L-threonylcarbamoyladenylate synthase
MTLISNCTAAVIKDAATSLIAGNLVAFPTETVYGLGADACNEDAVARIYEVKGRPKDHPLIVHISSINNLDNWAKEIPEYAIKLARAFWPGPMTLILPRTDLAKDFITGGQESVGIRVPSHIVSLSLLREFEAQGGYGVAAPSANRFGKVSPTNAVDVKEELDDYLSNIELILDGGKSLVGLESTIINCTNTTPSILRPGKITAMMISKLLGIQIELITKNNLEQIKVPGSLESHYSPKAKVIIGQSAKRGDGFIAMSHLETPSGATRLCAPASVDEFANVLYDSLRLGDKLGLRKIFCVLPEELGIGTAIVDRICRASAVN